MAKKKESDELGAEMEKLAKAMTEALKADLEEKKPVTKLTADAFGKLTTYFAATRKLNLKTDGDDDDGSSFDRFRSNINNTPAQTSN